MNRLNNLITASWKKGLTEEQVNQINTLLSPIVILKAIVLAIVGLVGVIYIAKGIQEWSVAYQNADSTTMNQAIKGIVGGILMAGASVVIALFGF